MPIITICSSANFYEQVARLQTELQAAGYQVIIPATALKMKASGDYDVSHYKTWFGDASNYHKKTVLMRGHFDEVAKADAIVVVNNEKHGVANYVGGNVLMVMAIAFHLHLPIYLLNDIPSESPFLEEVIGLESVPLHGDLSKIIVS